MIINELKNKIRTFRLTIFFFVILMNVIKVHNLGPLLYWKKATDNIETHVLQHCQSSQV